MNLNQASLPAQDMKASIAFYETLGLTLIVENEDYARLECPGGGATLSLMRDESGAGGAHLYFECDDLDSRVARLKGEGFTFDGPEDKRWLWREAWTTDPAGNEVCLYWAGENRRNPPWRVGGPLPRHVPSHVTKFAERTWRGAVWASVIIAIALLAGMAGYAALGPMGPARAFANAAMILSGMGPLDKLETEWGHIFEGVYALICGLLFFAVAGLALAPLLHRVLRRFHLEDEAHDRRG